MADDPAPNINEAHVLRRANAIVDAGLLGDMTELEAKALIVVLVKGDYRTGMVSVGVDTFAEKAAKKGVSPNKPRMRAALARLREKGILPVVSPGGGRAKATTRQLTVPMETVPTHVDAPDPAPETGTDTVPLSDEQKQVRSAHDTGTDSVPVSGDQKGVRSTHERGTVNAPKGVRSTHERGTLTVPRSSNITSSSPPPPPEADGGGGGGGEVLTEDQKQIDSILADADIFPTTRRELVRIPGLTATGVRLIVTRVKAEGGGAGAIVETLRADGAEECRQLAALEQEGADRAERQAREHHLAMLRGKARELLEDLRKRSCVVVQGNGEKVKAAMAAASATTGYQLGNESAQIASDDTPGPRLTWKLAVLLRLDPGAKNTVDAYNQIVAEGRAAKGEAVQAIEPAPSPATTSTASAPSPARPSPPPPRPPAPPPGPAPAAPAEAAYEPILIPCRADREGAVYAIEKLSFDVLVATYPGVDVRAVIQNYLHHVTTDRRRMNKRHDILRAIRDRCGEVEGREAA